KRTTVSSSELLRILTTIDLERKPSSAYRAARLLVCVANDDQF
ncbi:MAG: hypothetical protein RIS70_1274, partial [Planctomycetota bacterium]